MIDGKIPIASGTSVVTMRQSAAIIIYGIAININFMKDNGEIRCEISDNSFKIYNSDSKLGACVGFSAIIAGKKIEGMFAIYLIGNDDKHVRVIHYTIIDID